ncbi:MULTISPECIES: SDR family NAD(P)-dependent oxidoreductase [unclassified Pseudomonas]|uniref:SDR family NAD(P)-dependent oxidoreductase n=1 Tax=unclassified Pseudomonas TaxID=196821 RepID=UPI000D3AD305|nr:MULTISPECIES: SDR family NAD(P)-dependent oxidoreductase [unclassified Pseudomonas]RAU43809.1 SDR family NAD(P)-dependent oxidoreductase [Pseudomonas sp. RIT 409]RAU56297.1 SDR family NAD(P)-dependent oxidoreductase [Pseudomonas sp. RIT 412]
MSNKSTALVIGASRGLGLALAEEYLTRGWQVIATTRSTSEGLDKLQRRFGVALEIEQVDIIDLSSVKALRRRLDARELDTLFVNAGICKANELTPVQVAEKDYLDMLLTNALSPMRVIELFHDRVKGNGVVAAMSSELGSIADSTGFWELYSSSKAALNMLMKSFHARHVEDTRALLLVAPGWVRTDMGSQDALLEVSESIPLVVDVVNRNAGEPGLRFINRHGDELPW